jgi:hypothetical protein
VRGGAKKMQENRANQFCKTDKTRRIAELPYFQGLAGFEYGKTLA